MMAMDSVLQKNPYTREYFLPGMEVQACGPITQKAEVGGVKFEVSLGCIGGIFITVDGN